jgi:ABC-type Fe3+/spermidine/putrescine transport system ATPase subunit
MKGLSIEIRNLQVAYGEVEVLRGIDLSLEAGEFVALLGASGCGKTTLLRALAGFIPITAGDIRLNRGSISGLPPEKRGIAMMFQSYALWPHMSVGQNIGFALRLRGLSKSAIGESVDRMLSLVGLEGYANRNVTRLSGGQRQRVALARALAVDPPVLLLDEPLSNLDARIRHNMRHEIKSLQKRLGLSIILVTHDREEAMAMADRVVILERGRILQAGPPEQVYHRPNCEFVASFMGAENGYPVRVRRDGDRLLLQGEALSVGVSLPLARYPEAQGVNCPRPIEGEMVARFRSEAAFITPSGQAPQTNLALNARVIQHSYLGNVYRHTVAVGEHAFLVDHPRRVAVDQSVDICIPASALHLFAPGEPDRATAGSGDGSPAASPSH